MCLLDNDFLDQFPLLLLLHHQPDCFEEESEPFDHLCSYDLLKNLRSLILSSEIVSICLSPL
jgi:hypothetical protein